MIQFANKICFACGCMNRIFQISNTPAFVTHTGCLHDYLCFYALEKNEEVHCTFRVNDPVALKLLSKTGPCRTLYAGGQDAQITEQYLHLDCPGHVHVTNTTKRWCQNSCRITYKLVIKG